MAGVKGKSGGARENTGGARPGAGRKPAPPRTTAAKVYQTDDPDDFLRALMRDPKADFKDRMAAALALKKSGTPLVAPGKKAQQQADAERVVRRSLAPVSAPTAVRGHLRAVK
jgi:hypothetical protein